VFYWHELPLLGIVAVIPWSLTSLVAVALSITLVPMAPAGPPAVGGVQPTAARDLVDTLAGFASRYGAALVALYLGWRAQLRKRAASLTDVPGARSAERSEAKRSGAPR
jgi:hypothetical protein